ncbi:MAG: M1 family metallopeptidase [Ferruginibacter sp.]
MKIILSLVFVLAFINNYGQRTSGGKLKPEQANMDMKHYTIALDIDVNAKTISGFSIADFDLLKPATKILLDFADSFNIAQVKINGKNTAFDYRDNMITLTNPKQFPAGRTSVTVTYSGKPHVAIRPPWDDGFIWTKDSTGKPWVAVVAEQAGGKTFFPCKDHPSDEPDEGGDMIITVPKGLVVAGPGLLVQTKQQKNTTTFHWKTKYPINNYSLVFNVADYKKVSRNYTSVSGKIIPMDFYVLSYHQQHAAHHLELLERSMHIQEKYFGEYAWANEKVGLAETPHLGMEHQTMNAYGNNFKYSKLGTSDFDWLMHHELGHEWWGNKVTANDWADYWIQEGICNFGDGLARRELEGDSGYIEFFKNGALGFQNKKPVVQGKDLDEATAYIGDIYGKGAFFLHSVRYLIGDSIFFPAIKAFIADPAYTYGNNVNTDMVEQFFTKRSGINLKPMFDLFLRTTDRMEVLVTNARNGYHISVKNLNMDIPLMVTTSEGTKQLTIPASKQVIVKSSSLPIIDNDMYYFKRVIYE